MFYRLFRSATVTLATLTLATLCAGGMAVGGEYEDAVAADPTNSYIAKTAEDVPKVDRFEGGKRLTDALAKLPEGGKLYLHYTTFNAPGSGKIPRFINRLVPLNAAGEPDGVEITWTDWYHPETHTIPWVNGKQHGVEKVFMLNGGGAPALKAEIPWTDGKIIGEKKTYYENGQVQSITPYVDGDASGESKSWSQEGALVRVSTFKEGRLDGLMLDYWPGTEQVKRRIPYAAGKVDGVAQEYYIDGKLKSERAFKLDTLHGKDIQLDPNGKVSKLRYWLNGNQVDEATWTAAGGEAAAEPAK